MDKQKRYPPEVRERAVRMVFDHSKEHGSQWATICSIAGKLGMTAESLRRWVRQAERNEGLLTSDERTLYWTESGRTDTVGLTELSLH